MFVRACVRVCVWGKYHCTIDLLFDWFGIGCMTTDNFYFYLQNRLIQTSQTGAEVNGTVIFPPLVFPGATLKPSVSLVEISIELALQL